MKLLIVGGVAGGASAAARSRRLSEDAEIVLFERGPDVSFANCGLTGRLLPIVRWGSEDTWRPEFCCKPISPRRISAATKRINSIIRPHETVP